MSSATLVPLIHKCWGLERGHLWGHYSPDHRLMSTVGWAFYMQHLTLWGGTPKNWNYLLEDRPLVVQASPTRWVFWEPSVSLYQLALLWEAVFGFSEGFWRFNTSARFTRGDLRAHLPTPHWIFSSFWPKTAWPLYSILPIHPISPCVTFFLFPWMKIVLRGKHFADVEEVKQSCRSTKRHQNWRVKKLSNGKNALTGASHQMGSIGRWLKFKYVRIHSF